MIFESLSALFRSFSFEAELLVKQFANGGPFGDVTIFMESDESLIFLTRLRCTFGFQVFEFFIAC